MEIVVTDDSTPAVPPAAEIESTEVLLADGTPCDIAPLAVRELRDLQWEQEQVFARRILDAPKASPQRAEAVRHAYDTATRIVGVVQAKQGQAPVMGMHPRYGRLVVRLLSRWRTRGGLPKLLEIGYGHGTLLKQVADQGFPVAGIEVSPVMHEQACRLLGPDTARGLRVGDLLRDDLSGPEHRYSLIYWNDVFEHVPPDEIADYLERICGLLVPGGQLVTITPNWHMRPSDVTGAIYPPRTEAAGLHLKEYTLREVSDLLFAAGFRRVATPLFLTRARFVLWGDGLAGLKRLLEPGLERLPFRWASLLCRGLGFCCTIATKGE